MPRGGALSDQSEHARLVGQRRAAVRLGVTPVAAAVAAAAERAVHHARGGGGVGVPALRRHETAEGGALVLAERIGRHHDAVEEFGHVLLPRRQRVARAHRAIVEVDERRLLEPSELGHGERRAHRHGLGQRGDGAAEAAPRRLRRERQRAIGGASVEIGPQSVLLAHEDIGDAVRVASLLVLGELILSRLQRVEQPLLVDER